jgi:rhamnosyltransferase
MLASVIIITKNQKELIEKSLPILLKQNIKGGCEIIVVDSGSTDGAIEYIQKLPVRLIEIRPETFNFANAFNNAAKVAKGKYIIRLSGDVIPIDKNFLNEILLPFSDLKVGATYGRYVTTGRSGYDYPFFWSKKRFPAEITRYSIKPNPLMMLLSREHIELVTNLAGGCCAIRKTIWEKRPFNEKLLGGEDAEYAWFLHIVGFDIVCNPKASVIHEHKIEKIKADYFSKWSRLLVWEYIRYYLKKIIGKDSFINLSRKFSFQAE